MNGLLEFLLESIPANQVTSLIAKLAGNISNVRNLEQDDLGAIDHQRVFSQNFWDEFAKSEDYSTCFLNLGEINIAEKVVKNPSVQILYYEGVFDVTIILSTKDCKDVGLVLANDFFVWMKLFANSFSVFNYCGGLEPASDESTQLFSSKGIGPILEI